MLLFAVVYKAYHWGNNAARAQHIYSIAPNQHDSLTASADPVPTTMHAAHNAWQRIQAVRRLQMRIYLLTLWRREGKSRCSPTHVIISILHANRLGKHHNHRLQMHDMLLKFPQKPSRFQCPDTVTASESTLNRGPRGTVRFMKW